MRPTTTSAARAIAAACAIGSLLASGPARAGSFGPDGSFVADPAAVAYVDFETAPTRWLPEGGDPRCRALGFAIEPREDALDGASVAHLTAAQGCSERLMAYLPHVEASYRASVWMRHGSLNAQLVAIYQDGSGAAPTSPIAYSWRIRRPTRP